MISLLDLRYVRLGTADLDAATRYAVNILGVYQHYRWRAYLQECATRGISPWQGLQKSDRWQARDAVRRQELAFWTRGAGRSRARPTRTDATSRAD